MRYLLLLATLLSLVSTLQAQHRVDYSYAPARWYTPIGFIDDAQKSLVDHQGRLAYDFGPGPYARAKTTISVEPVGATVDSTSQTLLNPRIPIVLTAHIDGDLRWRQSAFALIPETPQVPYSEAPGGSWRRFEGMVGSPAWAPPLPGVDPAFRSVAWGTGRSIRYDVRVPAGAQRIVTLGFHEIYRKGPVGRVMDLMVEGAPPRTINLIKGEMKDFPEVYFFEAQDLDGDGWLNLEVTPSVETQDPNVLLNGIWVFPPETHLSAELVIEGALNSQAELFIDCGMAWVHSGQVRMDALRTEMVSDTGTLQVRIDTQRPLTVEAPNATLSFAGTPFLQTHPSFMEATRTEGGWLLSFPPKTRQVDVLVFHGQHDPLQPFPDLTEAERQTIAYWQRADLPWDRILVPDRQIQDLLDGGIRTLYQIRDVVDGHAQFQPGPSVYRGLWYGDGMWAVETVSLLDDRQAARDMLEAMLLHQDPTGRTGVMKPALLHRETAHFIYALCRYARLFQDWDWMEARWSALEGAMQHLFDLRKQASQDPDALYYSLLPPGLTDGGIGGIGATYGSIYWSLIAMAEAVRTAHDMERPEAEAWDAEFQDFLAAFRRAADRDMVHDEYGNRFLPTKMAYDPEHDVAQRGQWGPIHALYAGQFLSEDDPLIQGTLAMLDARTEEKHVISLGWLTGGVWPIFEAHRALAYNWLGDAGKTIELLYSFANHATPTLLWAEEQMPKAEGTRTAGDIPHTVGNMQVVRLVRYMLLLERETDLEVLPSLPTPWLHPGARLQLLALPTRFGPTTLHLEMNASGTEGTLMIRTPAPEKATGEVRLLLNQLHEAGYTLDDQGNLLPEQLMLPWNHLYRLNFRKAGP